MQEVRGDEQKPHSQGRGMRGELVHDSKAHRYAAYGKCGACAPTVRVLTWGDLHRMRCLLTDDRPGTDHTGISRSRRCGELPAASDESAAITLNATARRVATRVVTVQKSAAAIVVFRYFTRVADHEGPNMRGRTEQWAARYSTMKPDRASRVRRRLMLPVLCAFCA